MLSLRAPLRTFNSSSRYAFSVKIVNILKPAEIRHVRAGGHTNLCGQALLSA